MQVQVQSEVAGSRRKVPCVPPAQAAPLGRAAVTQTAAPPRLVTRRVQTQGGLPALPAHRTSEQSRAEQCQSTGREPEEDFDMFTRRGQAIVDNLMISERFK